MSTSNQATDPSTHNFATIFEAASNEYKTLTGKDLQSHPFAAALEINSPDSVLVVFQERAQAVDRFRKRHDKLIKLLTPIVHIIFTFSVTLGEGVGLVSLHLLYILVLQHPLLSHSPPPRQYLLELVSYSR
jgi:hypothetical protein